MGKHFHFFRELLNMTAKVNYVHTYKHAVFEQIVISPIF
jgi:hypothetical protein